VDGIEPKAKGAGDAVGATDTTGIDTAGVTVLGVTLSASAAAVETNGSRVTRP
jgi:hypothetical protein